MENDLNSSSSALFAMEISSDHISNGYFHSTNTFDDPFESALSSMVSSPTAHPSAGVVSGDAMMIRELIGRLGSICENTGDISPQSCIATANNTPLNSPPKFNLSSLSLVNQISPNFPTHPPTLAYFNGDPGFAERAAKFSSFGRGETGIGNRSGTNLQSGKLSRVSSCLSNREGSSGVMSEKISTEMGDSREGSSVSEPNTAGEIGRKAQNDANSRKRKSISEPKIKEDKSDKEEAEKEREESNSKRSKTEEEEAKRKNAGGESHNNSKDKQSSSKNNSNNNNINNIDSKNSDNGNNHNKEAAAKPEPPKDYIHVRARRGQATDSHSLAERARREKISERMKFLQDLVPGCNKVTGKATVLDEIINYVQSLQSQVEFLSMKLATVNPRMEFNMDALLSNDMFQCRGSSMPQTMYPIDQNSATQAFPFGYRSSQQLPPTLLNGIPNGTENPFSLNPLNPPKINGNPTIQLPSIAGSNDPMTQMPTFWQDDL